MNDKIIAYPENFRLTPSHDNLILDIPRCPTTVQFANEICYYLDYTNQAYGYASPNNWRCDLVYTLVNVLSGNAFNMADSLSDTMETREFVLDLLGFDFFAYTAESLNEADMKKFIMYYLNVNKRPVVLRYLPECFFGGIVIGYEQNGDVLLSFNYETFNFSPNLAPQVKKNTGWYKGDTVLYTVGERKSAPKLSDLYLRGLNIIRDTLVTGGKMNNESFYDDWQKILTLTNDDCLAELKRTKKVLGRFDVLNEEELTAENVLSVLTPVADPLWCEYAEKRYYGAHFIRQAKVHFPDIAESLEQAACCLDKIGPFVDEYIGKTGHDPVDMQKFGKLSVRKEMSEIVNKFKALETEFIECFMQIKF